MAEARHQSATPNLLLDLPTATSKLSSAYDLLFDSLRSRAYARLSLCRPVLRELSVFSLKEKLPGFLGAAQSPAPQVFSYFFVSAMCEGVLNFSADP